MRTNIKLPSGHGKTRRAEILFHFLVRVIRYRWSGPGGVILHGRTVVSASSKRGLAHAERRFWNHHTHVEAA
jgi:hypothetical protein